MRARPTLGLLATIVLSLTACGGSTAPVAASPTTSAAASAAPTVAAPVKVKASYGNITPANLAPLAALEGGFFKQNGLDVELQLIEGGTKSAAAIVSGDIQIAAFGGTEVMSAVAAGADLQIVSLQVPLNPWVFMAPASYRSPADLKGKSIGIVTKGGSSEVAALRALARLGVDPKDVQINAIGSVPNLAQAMIAGAAYAGPAHPPETVVLGDAGFKTIVDLVAEKVLSTDNTTVTTKRYIDTNRQTVQKYVDAQTQAIAKMKKDKAFTLEVLRKYKIVADDQRQMNSVYDFYVTQIFPLYTYPTKETFESTKAELVKTNPKVADLDVTRVFDASFVKNAEDRRVGQ